MLRKKRKKRLTIGTEILTHIQNDIPKRRGLVERYSHTNSYKTEFFVVLSLSEREFLTTWFFNWGEGLSWNVTSFPFFFFYFILFVHSYTVRYIHSVHLWGGFSCVCALETAYEVAAKEDEVNISQFSALWWTRIFLFLRKIGLKVETQKLRYYQQNID